jgi:hypothetical protein
VCGDTINFGQQIAASSAMSAFIVVHPLHVSPQNSVIDLGIRRIELAQLVPLYEQERAWLRAGGDMGAFLASHPGSVLMDPRRKLFPGADGSGGGSG